LPALNPIGKPFIELLTVESTNNYAMGLVRAGMAQHGTVIFAHEQTKGKGQRNKKWLSAKELNIAMSIVLKPKHLSSSQPFLISMMVAVAVQELLAQYIKNDIKIKWPNDIYWCDRKAAGVLIENIWQGQEWKFSVVGVGINVNQIDFAGLETKAVSIKQITGREFNCVVLAKELCEILEDKYQLLLSNCSRVVEQYKANLYKLQEYVQLKKDQLLFEAKFQDVNSMGQMVVQHQIEEKFDVGDIEWIINAG
jgi:BirA family transcriptional regulator, biotin operon repressor / biotin---[acetyl-CoA-carboxylase] ligase